MFQHQHWPASQRYWLWPSWWSPRWEPSPSHCGWWSPAGEATLYYSWKHAKTHMINVHRPLRKKSYWVVVRDLPDFHLWLVVSLHYLWGEILQAEGGLQCGTHGIEIWAQSCCLREENKKTLLMKNVCIGMEEQLSLTGFKSSNFTHWSLVSVHLKTLPWDS